MYINCGYINNTRVPIKDKSKPLIVSCCGTYKLKSIEKLPTWRPRGRLDYQLLYVATGKTQFFFNGEEKTVTAGNMVLIQPRQEQKYNYYAKDNPHVYWVHFTGSDVKNILRSYNIPLDNPVFFSGVSPLYENIFKEIINEIQLCKTGYQELITMYLKQIFILVERTLEMPRTAVASYIQGEMEIARRYLTEHYNENISIKEYAASQNMSVSWLQRKFKESFDISPMQYLLSVRINRATELLETSNYNITQIASIVGYDDPLYFSRLYSKIKGVSPTEYRKAINSISNN